MLAIAEGCRLHTFTLLLTCHRAFNPLDADAMLQLAGLKFTQPSTYWDLIQHDTGGWAVAHGVCLRRDRCCLAS